MARLTTASPVFEDGGKLVGVVSTIIDFDYLWERIDTFTNHQQNMGLGGFAFLINDSGKVIAHQDDSMILNYNFLKQYDLTKTDFEQLMSNRETIHSDVNDMLQTFVKIAQTPGFTNDWYVGVAVSNEKIQEPLRMLLIKYILLFVCVLLFMLLAIYKLSSFIVAPLQRLVDATSDFAFGKRIYPLPPADYQEVDTLTRTFNMMTRRLIEREKKSSKINIDSRNDRQRNYCDSKEQSKNHDL